jgi:hypothetical protein
MERLVSNIDARGTPPLQAASWRLSEETNMKSDDIHQEWQDALAQLDRGDGSSEEAFRALNELGAHLRELLFPDGPSADYAGDVDPADPRLQLLLDALAAQAVLEPGDPAYPWERGGLLSEFGRHLEAAEDYLAAARLFDREAEAATGLTGDEDDWAKSARYHAAKNLALGGHPTAAAALLPQLDPEDRAEVEPIVGAKASETIL